MIYPIILLFGVFSYPRAPGSFAHACTGVGLYSGLILFNTLSKHQYSTADSACCSKWFVLACFLAG